MNCGKNPLSSLPVLPNSIKKIFCAENILPYQEILTIDSLNNVKNINAINKFKSTYYKIKYGTRLERYHIKNIRNKEINKELIDIVYSPNFNFYKRLLNSDVTKMFA